MSRAKFSVAAAFLRTTVAAASLVTYQSPCECLDNHGKQRWPEKNDPAQPLIRRRFIRNVRLSFRTNHGLLTASYYWLTLIN